MAKVWIRVEAAPAALDMLRRIWPDLEEDSREASVFLTRPGISLDPAKTAHETAKAFVDTANALMALEEVGAMPISSLGAIEIEDEGGARTYAMAAEPGRYSLTGSTVVFSTRGIAGRKQPRPLSVRAAELAAASEDFRRAAGEIFAAAKDDLPKLFMVIEAIEQEFGLRGRSPSEANWKAFCEQLGVVREDWRALRRTCRPDRHFKVPFDDPGRTYTREQVRAFVQHALKLWVDRALPD